MRSSFAVLCGLALSLVGALRAEVRWDFSSGNPTPSTTPANLTGGTITAGNGTFDISLSSPSTTYAGASGTNNLAFNASPGALSAASSDFLEFTLTAGPGLALKASSLSLGSRSTSSGPVALALFSSADNFASPIASASIAADSDWALVTLGGFNVFSSANGSLTFRLYASGGSGSGTGNWRVDDLSLNVALYTPPTIVGPPRTVSVAYNSPANISVSANGSAPFTYQWRKDGAPIAGNVSATTATLTFGAVTRSDAGTYDVVVTDANGSAISSPATLTITKAPATVTIDDQVNVYNGTSQPANAATTPANLPLTFSYTATSGTIYGPSPTAPLNAGTYAVTATVNDANYEGSGSGTLTIAKSPATVVLGSLARTYNGAPQPITATTTPPGISILYTYNGSSVAPSAAGTHAVAATVNHPNFSGSATGSLVIARAPASLSLAGLAAGYTGATQTPTASTTPPGQPVAFTFTGIDGTAYGPSATPPTDAGTYSVNASIPATHGNTAVNYTGSATGTFVIAPTTQTIAFPQPPDQLANAAPLTLAATSTSGLPVSFTIVSGSPAVATLAGNVLTLTGTTGSVTIRASQPGNANIAAAPTVERTFEVVASATPPVFTLQPANTDAFVGAPVQLTVNVTGAPAPQLQWRKANTDIPGATHATLSIASATLADTAVYHVVATNLAGSVTSSPAILSVTKRPQTISFPVTATAFPAGTGITLPVASDSNLPVTLTLVSGSASLAGNTITGAGGEVVVRASQPGNDLFAAAEPVERTLRFIAGLVSPFVVSPPADRTANTGASVTLRATAIGTPAPTYQWQKDGAALLGATHSALTLDAVTIADTGRYTIVATNAAGTASASAQLTVHEAPAIVASPESRTVFAGTPATFTVAASGAPTPALQWRRNGTALPGATGATLTLSAVTTADAGTYDVVASNLLGSVTSAAAELTVNTRDFSGAYLGRIAAAGGAEGDFALHVRPDATAVFLAHLPGLQTGIAALNLRVDSAGNFSLNTTTLAAAPTSRPIAAAPQPITLRGTLDSDTGALTGTIAELGAAFATTRAPATGPAAAHAGLYPLALLGTATGRGYAIVAADGETFVFTTDGAALDTLRGRLDADGRLVAKSTGGADVDLVFEAGALRGSARTASGTTLPLAGATDALTGAEHLVNLSVRSSTSAADPLITGFVITGPGSKRVLLRAAGPALAAPPFNVTGALANPSIQVFRGNTQTAQNDNWGTPASNVAALNAATTQVGAFPLRNGSNDAALLATLTPGAYTMRVTGGNGATLAEIYEVLQPREPAGARRLVNVSARGTVAPGAPLIAGLVIGGTAPQRVLIRGVGPRLATAPFNVRDALVDPQLTLFRGTTTLRSNDDWFRDTASAPLIRDAAVRAGAFPLANQSRDAALLLYLEPGAYTVQLTSPNNAATGTALIEVYEAAP